MRGEQRGGCWVLLTGISVLMYYRDKNTDVDAAATSAVLWFALLTAAAGPIGSPLVASCLHSIGLLALVQQLIAAHTPDPGRRPGILGRWRGWWLRLRLPSHFTRLGSPHVPGR